MKHKTPRACAEARTPQFRVGDWVEVRPLEDIMDTLDGQGRLANMPFMPEMARYCGRRFRIAKSAHTTCDPAGQTNMRKLVDTVHLNTRCDGSAHDGCEARCLIFWKTAWLKRVDGPSHTRVTPQNDRAALEWLRAMTNRRSDEGLRYCCQATEIVHATTPLSHSELNQYVDDIATGNVSSAHAAEQCVAVVTKAALSRLGKLNGRGAQSIPRAVSSDEPPPLNLHAGELVRIRPAKDILSTLDTDGKNRGLALEAEMLRYCGRVFRVAGRVDRVIDEATGQMVTINNDCIVLDGLVCRGLDNSGRLFCPRSPFFYWREAWLERAEPVHEIVAPARVPYHPPAATFTSPAFLFGKHP